MKKLEMSPCRFPCHPDEMVLVGVVTVVVVGDSSVVFGAGQVWGWKKELNNNNCKDNNNCEDRVD